MEVETLGIMSWVRYYVNIVSSYSNVKSTNIKSEKIGAMIPWESNIPDEPWSNRQLATPSDSLVFRSTSSSALTGEILQYYLCTTRGLYG